MKKPFTILLTLMLFAVTSLVPAEAAEADDLVITGFFDVTGTYSDGNDDATNFALNRLELHFDRKFSEKSAGEVVAAYNSNASKFELAVAQFGLNLHNSNEDFVTSVTVHGGKFDVPFGIDYQVNPSPKRRLAANRPLVTLQTHGSWNDYGFKFNAESESGNLVVFWVNGFASSFSTTDTALALSLGVTVGEEMNTTPANAIGGRLGVTPVENFEVGSSWSIGINESGENETSLFGVDFQYELNDRFSLKGEYINHLYNRSYEEGKQNGYYFQSLYSFDKMFLVGRYGSVTREGEEINNRFTAGIGWIIEESVEFRFATSFYKDSNDNTNILQLVAAF
ncbi:MAG: hypothetical protein IIA17_03735 [candidate division Zixibacteria bacterium]|nr:hypothetical protein [candidate division Zixibacteria bacterium]